MGTSTRRALARPQAAVHTNGHVGGGVGAGEILPEGAPSEPPSVQPLSARQPQRVPDAGRVFQ